MTEQGWILRRNLLRVGALMLAIALLAVGAFIIYRVVMANRVKERLDAIRAAGLPTTMAELDAWYPSVPDGENAGPIYEEAFLQLVTVEPEDDLYALLPYVGVGPLPDPREPPDEATLSATAGHLKMNERALQLLHEAAAFDRCRYDVDLSVEAFTDAVDTGRATETARLLQLEAVHHAARGDTDAAVGSVLSLLKLGRSFEPAPEILPQLVRLACLGIARESVHHLIESSRLTDEQLSRLAVGFARSEDTGSMARAIVGERCFWNLMVTDHERVYAELPAAKRGEARAQILVLELAGLWDSDYALALDEQQQLIELITGPLPQRPPGLAAWSSNPAGELKRLHMLQFLWYLMKPTLYKLSVREMSAIAYGRAATAALAVERYRLEHGQLPASLGVMVPDYLEAVPLDPFDGEPLRYKVLADGYVVYSVGKDLVDDGGEDEYGTGEPDVIFMIGGPQEADGE